MTNPRLNQRQKATVNLWQDRQPSKIAKIIDRTCGYRDVYLAWEFRLNQPNNQIATIDYQTRLELTKIGKIRVEETLQIDVRYSAGTIKGETVPLLFYLPPVPPLKIDRSCYPRSRNSLRAPQFRPKNRQLSLPLSDTEQKLLNISLRHGDPTIYSREDLLSGREGWYSLNQRRTVFLPAPILTLLKEFDCSLEECEMVAMYAGVVSPQAVLNFVEQIPFMRSSPSFPAFAQPISVKPPASVKPLTNLSQPQRAQ
ncbi:MAG: hypothetical protein KME09_01710 [Pleurocapsa minor HA4230-MV1]|jgi:hypothetical protein|nr:hypothetical protein [Pleurocapsa minor HA4230-MV1]